MSHQLPPELARHLDSFDGTLTSLDTFLTEVSGRLKFKRELIAKHEMRFRKLLEQAHDGIALLGQDKKLTYVTPAVLKDFGYTEDELLNDSGSVQLGHPEEKDMLVEFIEEMMKCPGQTKQINYRVKTKSGEWRWIRSNVTNLIDEPSIGALVFNYEDITEKVNLEHQKEIDRQNRDALINSTNDLMWSLDTEMRLVACNNAFVKRIRINTGLEIKIGDALLNPVLYSADKLKKWADRYRRALRGDAFTVDDFFDLAPAEKWDETTLNPIYKGNEIIGVSCFLRVITEKKVASEAIRQSQETMAVAQSISNFGSWECYFDTEGNVRPHSLKWSDELYRICGHEPGDFKLSYESFQKHIHPDDIAKLQQAMKNAFNKDTVYECEYRIIRKSGEVRWIKSQGKTVLRNQDKPLKMVGTGQDVTERKLTETERNKLINDLIQRNKDLEQFAYIVSHNLRAPVAHILGLVNVFKGYNGDRETQLKCLEGLDKSTKALDNVILDLNEILQIRKQLSERKTVVNFDQLINEIRENLHSCLQKEKGTIHVDFTDAPEMFTLKGYIYSIFYNLILNSLKYRKADVPPIIHIKSGMLDNRLALAFTDNGIGIDLDMNRGKIFGLYKRFANHVEGKGVGLYMVKTQVEALNGKISVASKVNVGTTFTIEFEPS